MEAEPTMIPIVAATEFRRPEKTPRTLEYSFWLRHRGKITVFASVGWTILIMFIGVMIVCFTFPPVSDYRCQLRFVPTTRQPLAYQQEPVAVALGDFNHDSILDMVVAFRAMNDIGIYIGYGDSSFQNPIRYSTGLHSRPRMVVTGDFNRDSHLDVVVANFGTNNLAIFHGFGNGSLAEPIHISMGSSRPYSLIAVDCNNDTLLDLVVADYGTSSISVLYQTNDGSFSPRRIYSIGDDSFPIALAAGDFNRDSYLDLAIVDYGTNDVLLMFGNDDRNWTTSIRIATGLNSKPRSIAVGDFDQDGSFDMAVANQGTHSLILLFNRGNGTFTEQTVYENQSLALSSIHATDVNQDQKLDLVLISSTPNNIVVLLAFGNGTFMKPISYSTGVSSSSISVAIGDLNSDRRTDVIFINSATSAIDIFLGAFEGFSAPARYPTGEGPYALAMGDFNHDSQLDLVIVNEFSNTISIRLGRGDGSFEHETTYRTGWDPVSVAVGDLNNDGHLDIVVANYISSTVSVFLGIGNGHFMNKIDHRNLASPSFVTVGDFNNDQRLDLAVAHYMSSSISILFGHGNGSFQPPGPYWTGSNPIFIALGDFDNNRQLDLVVAHRESPYLTIFLGHANGSFDDPMAYFTGDSSHLVCVALGDFNADQHLDIVAAHHFGMSAFAVFFGFGNGSFAARIEYPIDTGTTSIAVGDINNDNRLDLAITNSLHDEIIILFGMANGSFTDRRKLRTGRRPRAVALRDLNHDTRLDLVVAHHIANTTDVLLQHNRGFLQNTMTYAVGGGSVLNYLALADVNNDSQLDVVVTNEGTDNIVLLLGDGKGNFSTQSLPAADLSTHSSFVVVADFNGDAHVDLAIPNHASKRMDILLGKGEGTFILQQNDQGGETSAPLAAIATDFNHDGISELAVTYAHHSDVEILNPWNTGSFILRGTYRTGSWPRAVAVGDFNQDNQLDFVVVHAYVDFISIFFGDGTGSFRHETKLNIPIFSTSVATGDFNNDTRLDIVFSSSGSDNIVILLAEGNGSFSKPLVFPIDVRPSSIAVADFNHDTRLDLVTTNADSNDVRILLGYGNGSFAYPMTFPVGNDSQSVAIGDFNFDLHLDLVVVNRRDNNVSILLGHGNGSFDKQMTFSTGFFSSSVAVGDFNHDERLDLAVTNEYGWTVSILLGYGNGSFADHREFLTGAYPVAVVVEDLNKDGQLDLAITNYGSNEVSILLGFGNGSFFNQMTVATGLSPRDLVTADFNGDHRLDIICVNLGDDSISVLIGMPNLVFLHQTTLPTVNGSSPQALAIGDFNDDHQMDILIADAQSHTIAIFLGHGNFTFDEPIIQFIDQDSSPYSVAVADFNRDTCLDLVSINRHSHDLNIFRGLCNGSFVNYSSCSSLSDAEPYFVTAHDLNNDTILDIIVANYGRNSLRIHLGYGDGTFGNPLILPLSYGSRPFFVVVGDFNRDQKVDLAIGNKGTDSLSVLLQTCSV